MQKVVTDFREAAKGDDLYPLGGGLLLTGSPVAPTAVDCNRESRDGNAARAEPTLRVGAETPDELAAIEVTGHGTAVRGGAARSG